MLSVQPPLKSTDVTTRVSFLSLPRYAVLGAGRGRNDNGIILALKKYII
jgi:hypothetical protein